MLLDGRNTIAAPNDDSPEEPECALCEQEDESGDSSVTNAEETAVDRKCSSSDTNPNVPDYSTGRSSSSRRRPTEGNEEVEGGMIAHTPSIGSEMERKIPYDWMVKRRGAQGSSSCRSSGTSPRRTVPSTHAL